MSIDKATVQKIASLARIKVTEDDLNYYAPQLQKILGWAEQLQEVAPRLAVPQLHGAGRGRRRGPAFVAAYLPALSGLWLVLCGGAAIRLWPQVTHAWRPIPLTPGLWGVSGGWNQRRF